MNKKSQRSDSAAYAIKAAMNAQREIEPPAHLTLREDDYPFWRAITRARAADTWNDVDLAKAANLARCQADIERVTQELLVEGDTLVNQRGTVVMNPKHSLLEILSRREIALSRVIHVHAEATVGKSEDAAKKLSKEKAIRESINDLDDELIPRLKAVK